MQMQPKGSSSTRIDIYQKVTETIIGQIEAGAGQYSMPWHLDGSPVARPRNPVACHVYRGINVLMLAVAARTGGYPSGLWATYRQWQLAGAQVREGEKGTLIVFWKILDRPAQPYIEDQEQDTPRRIVARGFWVFNAAQVDSYVPVKVPVLSESERDTEAEQFCVKLGIETRFEGDEACYHPVHDRIQMPPFDRFKDAPAFYATLLHEAAHASGALHRLNRDLSGRFGSEAYAMEEMVADWASAMACGTLQITPEPRTDYASYIGSWLKVLRGDKRAVFAAATQAQKVVDWMWGRQKDD
jgi:antirestriction protein ArdC